MRKEDAKGGVVIGPATLQVANLTTGTALDIFAGNDVLATVYARLPFPGAPVPKPETGPRYFSLFEEKRDRLKPGELHRYAMIYDRARAEVVFEMDEEEIGRHAGVMPIGPCLLAMGLMTEKDIDPGKGSTSCHGQGAVGTWGDIRVTLETP